MASPAEVVASSFAQAQNYANAAQTALTSFTNALNSAIYTPPSLSVTWTSLVDPTLPTLPVSPTLPTISYTGPAAPSTLALTAPGVTIDTFTEVAPTVALPAAPTPTYGVAPTVPTVATITTPTAPVLATVAAPTYLSLSTPTFAGIDLHAANLAKLDQMPTLNLVAPTPYSYSVGPKYASQLLDSLKATLNARLAGGTGLNPAVEQAIWDRARSRETKIAQANIDEIARQSDALGFQLPSGIAAARMREAQQDYYDKLSGLSRDVAIKQAELEQENLKSAIAQGLDLEGRLIDYSYKLESLTFEAAKTLAENALGIYNARVDEFKALMDGYRTYAAAYDAIIRGELAKVEVYKAQIDGEQAKADVNRAMVEQYKAAIDATLAQVKIYEAQVGAANTLVQIEQVKVQAAGEQIRAYVAQINAETAKVEAYKATVQGQEALVNIYKTKAEAFTAKVHGQAAYANAQIEQYRALVQAKAAEWDGFRAQVEAERSRIAALGTQSTALVEGYKAGAAAVEAQANLTARVWEVKIKNYEAGQSIALQAGKINSDNLIATNNARLDAAKAGAQVYAQLTSSAYSMIHAQASVSAGSQNGVSYSYSGDVTNAVSPVLVA